MSTEYATNPAVRRYAAQCGAIGALIVLASFPAWTGDWIYDDWAMIQNSKMDDVSDLIAVFGRTSVDYLGSSAIGPMTYRPLPMATLIIGRLISDDPLPHHLMSLALHLACVGLLALTALRVRGPMSAVWVAVIFGLHPLGIEAYGWINGRSDPLSCFGLAMVAYALFCPINVRLRLILSLVGAAVAVLSKETATVALLGVSLAALLPARSKIGERARLQRAMILPVLGCWLVVGGFVLTRVVMVGHLSAGPTSLFETPGSWIALTRLFAVATDSVLIPLPRTMNNLGHALAQPMGPSAWLLLLVPALVSMVFLRNLRSLTILACAALYVVPCVMLRHAYWLGLDRYLYVPLFLSCLAWIVAPTTDRERSTPRRVTWIGAPALAGILAVSTWFTAETYQNSTKHMVAMIQLRPDDPSGNLMGARRLWRGHQKAQAHAMIDRIPHTGLPAPLAGRLATQLGEMGRQREAIAVVDDMARRYPTDPYVLMAAVSVGIERGRLDIVFEAIDQMQGHRRFCESAREDLKAARNTTRSTTDAQRIDHFLSTHRCR